MLQVFGLTVKHYLMVPSGKPIKNPIPYLGGRFRVYLLNVIPFAPPFGLAPAIHPMLLKNGETTLPILHTLLNLSSFFLSPSRMKGEERQIKLVIKEQ